MALGKLEGPVLVHRFDSGADTVTESRSEPAPESLQQQPLVPIHAVIHEWELLRQREEDAFLYWRKSNSPSLANRHLSAAQALTVGINILRALPW